MADEQRELYSDEMEEQTGEEDSIEEYSSDSGDASVTTDVCSRDVPVMSDDAPVSVSETTAGAAEELIGRPKLETSEQASKARRQQWVAAMRRSHWTPTAHSRLCSEHFVSGRKSDSPVCPDYVPSLFKFLSPEQRQQKFDNYLEFARKYSMRLDVDANTENSVDNSDDVQAREDGSPTENAVDDERSVPCIEEKTVETSPVMDDVDELPLKLEALKDDDDHMAKRKLEIEADDIEDGGPSPKICKAKESAATNIKRNRNYDRFSLGKLAKKFSEMIDCHNMVFDLNAIAQRLDIPKRRLYDVTNVLQGVMLLEKDSKNFVRWLGPRLTPHLKTELPALVQAEITLDELIEDCKSQLHQLYEDSYSHGYAYVTYEDLQMIPTLRDQTVIAVKAPVETKVEVSHPEESFQIYLSSNVGPIDVFMCCDNAVPNQTLASVPSPNESSCGIDPSPVPLAEQTPHSSPVAVGPHLSPILL